ncbi:deferrochelatase/peroxidase EfeB [Haloferula luteola]|uniref:Deferrochelatase/peroxidase EfeB n=1 Tax=Haloferula luteola TaxID=595692 RepID=A0A840V2D5_9BACT|nr:Dyp-type peroxidase domain-containing protein [Haloferula luteola]MBB5351623.1 deferrochelatase/peroxidase EfeB [Haloferula luteola]
MSNSPKCEERPKRPYPDLNGSRQPGIADPQWPVETPCYVPEEKRAGYVKDFAGRVDTQDWITAIFFDVNVCTRDDLKTLLEDLSKYARKEMAEKPPESEMDLWIPRPDSRRVTVTIGFGTGLFLSAHGDDRFGLRHKKPKWLREMPKTEVDDFEPSEFISDLVVIIASDADQVNDSLLMELHDGRWHDPKTKKPDKRLTYKRSVSGYQRLDYRDHLRVADGAANLTNVNGDIDKLVFIRPEDMEPAWCVDGSYLLWKEIQLDRPLFESMTPEEQSGIIGRNVENGDIIPGKGHILKVQPRRGDHQDILGVRDEERRFLRRGYIFIGNDTPVVAGRLFFSYMRSLEKQGDWAVQMWQSAPNFPTTDYGVDPLFKSKVAKALSGGYYFCPPNAAQGSFVGAGLFD